MLKVLHLIYYPGQGGAEKYVLSLAKKLHNQSCKFYFGYAVDGPMLGEVKSLGIQAFNVPMKNYYDLNAARRIAKLCREHSIDVIHTHFLRENYISVLSKLFGNKAGLINTSHVIYEKNPFLKLSNRLFTTFDDKIIDVCHMGKKHIMGEGIREHKIEVIHNGVDVGYWGAGEKSTIRQELGIGNDEFVVASTARFSEEKGHRFLIESIAEFNKLRESKALPNVRFILAGDGEILDECKKLAEHLGNSEDIIFPGYRTDIRNILHGSNLFVSPSKNEALSISNVEALASGLPVVATNVGGTSEVINEESSCGMLVEYGDREALARAIMRFIQDRELYDTCKLNAVKTVNKKFNLDNMVLKTYNLYDEIKRKK